MTGPSLEEQEFPLNQPVTLPVHDVSKLPSAKQKAILIMVVDDGTIKLGLSDGTQWHLYAPEE